MQIIISIVHRPWKWNRSVLQFNRVVVVTLENKNYRLGVSQQCSTAPLMLRQRISLLKADSGNQESA